MILTHLLEFFFNIGSQKGRATSSDGLIYLCIPSIYQLGLVNSASSSIYSITSDNAQINDILISDSQAFRATSNDN